MIDLHLPPATVPEVVVVGDNATAEVGDWGIAEAGFGGAAAGGEGAQLRLRWRDEEARRTRLAVAYVGEDGILPHVRYRVDDTGHVERSVETEELSGLIRKLQQEVVTLSMALLRKQDSEVTSPPKKARGVRVAACAKWVQGRGRPAKDWRRRRCGACGLTKGEHSLRRQKAKE